MTYFCCSDGVTTFPLSGWPVAMQEEAELLDAAWAYDSTDTEEGIAVSRLYRGKREFTLSLSLVTEDRETLYNLLDQLERIAAVDAAAATPGRLYHRGSYLSAFLTGWTLSDWDELSCATDLKLSLLSPFPYWVSTTQYRFLPSEADGTGKTYPYYYPYHYANSLVIDTGMVNPASTPSEFILTLFGPCDNPSVHIGGHTYHLDLTLAEGERVVIDSQQKTILKTAVTGVKTNCYHLRSRSDYIFQRIPVGPLTLGRSANFGCDLTLCQIRSFPKWT